MKKRSMITLAAAIAMVAVAVAPVLAITVSGTGTLTATGRGSAWLRGSGTVTVSGNGALYLKDHAGDAEVNVTGYEKRVTLKDGTVVYSRFRGRAQITGSDVKMQIKGVGIHLTAAGTGQVVLRGKGTYRIGDRKGVWTPGGTIIKLSS